MIRKLKKKTHGPIAQLEEPPAHNRSVPGSNPGGPINSIEKAWNAFHAFFSFAGDGNMPSVQDIINLMEEMAPCRLAESWDAVGLQVGRKDRPVRSIWVALDPLPEVVSAACDQHVDLLITHHPLLFQPVKKSGL